MRRSTRRKIIIVGVLLVTYSAITYGLPYLIFDAPFARVNATETLKERFSRKYTQSLDVKYSKGSPQLSRESPSGTVLGYVTDTKIRQKLLQAQPFADCSGGCSSWQPYSEYGNISPLLSIEQNSSPDSRNILRAATGEGGQCVARYHPKSRTVIYSACRLRQGRLHMGMMVHRRDAAF